MYPKSRIDGLTDGIFGVAMTILVLDVRLPDTFHSDPTGLVAAPQGSLAKVSPLRVELLRPRFNVARKH